MEPQSRFAVIEGQFKTEFRAYLGDILCVVIVLYPRLDPEPFVDSKISPMVWQKELITSDMIDELEQRLWDVVEMHQL